MVVPGVCLIGTRDYHWKSGWNEIDGAYYTDRSTTVRIYKATWKYSVIFLFSLVLCVMFLFSSVLSILAGFHLFSLLMILVSFVILYHLLFVLAREITVKETEIIYKTIIRRKNIKFSEIREIKSIYTMRSLVLAGGDRQKARMACAIILKDKPFNVLLFGSAIRNYKELHKDIQYSLEKIRGNRGDRGRS